MGGDAILNLLVTKASPSTRHEANRATITFFVRPTSSYNRIDATAGN